MVTLSQRGDIKPSDQGPQAAIVILVRCILKCVTVSYLQILPLFMFGSDHRIEGGQHHKDLIDDLLGDITIDAISPNFVRNIKQGHERIRHGVKAKTVSKWREEGHPVAAMT